MATYDTSLPPGWQEIIDGNTGTPYYHNASTGESVWERPIATVPVATPVAAPTPVPVAAPLALGEPGVSISRGPASSFNMTESPYAINKPTSSNTSGFADKFSDMSSSKKRGIIAFGGLLVLLAVVLGALAGTGAIGGSSGGNGQETGLPSSSSAASGGSVGGSGQGRLIFAVSNTQVRANGQPRIVARSYDGNDWEAMPDSEFPPVDIRCEGGRCSIVSTDSYSFQSVAVPDSVANPPATAKASRLLMQGGFFAPMAEIERVASRYGDNVGQWVLDQMRAAPTYSRAYMRQRSNPRVYNYSTNPQPQTGPCDIDSRWMNYVLEGRDRGNEMVVTRDNGAQRFVLSLLGVVRGHTTSFLGKNFPGNDINVFNVTGTATYVVCDLYEGIGSRVTIVLKGGNCNTNSHRLYFDNPRLEFASPPAGLGTALQSINPENVLLVPVTGGSNGSYIMSFRSSSVTCTLVANSVGDAFMRVGTDTYYRFDQRGRFWDNTL